MTYFSFQKQKRIMTVVRLNIFPFQGISESYFTAELKAKCTQ